MLPCNMIRSRQPRPATSSSLRRLPPPPFYYTYPPILCVSPLPTSSPNSTHPSQLDTPVPSQLLCYQSHPHAFRHTWGSASVSTSDFEFSSLTRSSRRCPHQYHSAPLSRPLFSYSYALFCHAQNTNSRILNHLRTLCRKHPGWGYPLSNEKPSFLPIKAACLARTSRARIHISRPAKERTNPNYSEHAKMDWYSGGDTVSTEAVAARRHAGTHLPVTWWKLEMPTTTWHLLLN